MHSLHFAKYSALIFDGSISGASKQLSTVPCQLDIFNLQTPILSKQCKDISHSLYVSRLNKSLWLPTYLKTLACLCYPSSHSEIWKKCILNFLNIRFLLKSCLRLLKLYLLHLSHNILIFQLSTYWINKLAGFSSLTSTFSSILGSPDPLIAWTNTSFLTHVKSWGYYDKEQKNTWIETCICLLSKPSQLCFWWKFSLSKFSQ